MKITLDIPSMLAGAAIAVAIPHLTPDLASLAGIVARVPVPDLPGLPAWLSVPAMTFSPQTSWHAFLALMGATVVSVFATSALRSDEGGRHLSKLHRRFPTSMPPNLDAAEVPAPRTPEEFLFACAPPKAKLAMWPTRTIEIFLAELAGPDEDESSNRDRTEAKNGAEKALADQVRNCDASPMMAAIRLALDICLTESDASKRNDALDYMAACAWREIAAAGKGVPLSVVGIGLDGFFARYRAAYPPTYPFDASHHHPCTQMLAQMDAARKATDLPPASAFLWLRHVDPLLWHVVDNAGRKTFSVDGLGPLAHYKAEKAARQPIVKPAVADAAGSLVDHCIARQRDRKPPAT